MHFLQATNCFVLASALALAVPACTPAQDLPHAASADDGGIDADHDDDADVTRHEGGIDSDADVAIGSASCASEPRTARANRVISAVER